jgi:hypothetical protein
LREPLLEYELYDGVFVEPMTVPLIQPVVPLESRTWAQLWDQPRIVYDPPLDTTATTAAFRDGLRRTLTAIPLVVFLVEDALTVDDRVVEDFTEDEPAALLEACPLVYEASTQPTEPSGSWTLTQPLL